MVWHIAGVTSHAEHQPVMRDSKCIWVWTTCPQSSHNTVMRAGQTRHRRPTFRRHILRVLVHLQTSLQPVNRSARSNMFVHPGHLVWRQWGEHRAYTAYTIVPRRLHLYLHTWWIPSAAQDEIHARRLMTLRSAAHCSDRKKFGGRRQV